MVRKTGAKLLLEHLDGFLTEKKKMSSVCKLGTLLCSKITSDLAFDIQCTSGID